MDYTSIIVIGIIVFASVLISIILGYNKYINYKTKANNIKINDNPQSDEYENKIYSIRYDFKYNKILDIRNALLKGDQL